MRNENLPWIEKYRPKSLNDVAGQEHIVERLKLMVESIKNGDNNMPHLLFVGDAGIGKTSCAESLARDAFGSEWKANWRELNASDDRGINVVRTTIKSFGISARLPHSELGKIFNIVFLDEADALTPDAQAALRRPMEKYSGTCRFILSVNNSNKIISPIQNRCQIFRFHPLDDASLEDMIDKIAKAEEIKLTSDAKAFLSSVSQGSIRKMINLLWTLALQPNEITKPDIQKLIDYVPYEKVELLLKACAKGDLDKGFRMIDELYWKGFSVEDILGKTFDAIRKADWVSDKSREMMITRMAETEHYIIVGSNPLFQLKCFFAWVAEKSARKR